MRCNSNSHGVPNCSEPVFIPPGETTGTCCFVHFLAKVYIAGKITGTFSRPDSEAYIHLPNCLIEWLESNRINRSLGITP